MTILFFVYMAFGYWATGRTIYVNKILIGTGMTIFMRRLVMGTILGWILIPIAVIKMLLGSSKFEQSSKKDLLTGEKQ